MIIGFHVIGAVCAFETMLQRRRASDESSILRRASHVAPYFRESPTYMAGNEAFIKVRLTRHYSSLYDRAARVRNSIER